MNTTIHYPSNPKNYSNILRKCLAWREKGFGVLPLRGKYPHKDLLPKNRKGDPTWGVLRDHPANRNEILGWFKRDPGANYGVLCGSGLVVIDVDHADRLPTNLHLTPTYTVSTSRGYHLYYKGNLRSKAYPWGEVRSNGCYVVGSGSVHKTGEVYQAVDDSIEIVELPDHLIRYFSSTPKQGKGSVLRMHMHTEYTSLDPDRASDRKNPGDYFRDPDLAVRAMELMGYEGIEIGKPIRCPWHEEDQHPSAALYRQTEDCQYLIHDFHSLGHKGEWLTLSDLYAKHVTGERRYLGDGERVTWGIRLLNHLDVIDLPEIDAPDLPEDAPQAVKKLWEGFTYLLRCREWYSAGQNGTPFAYDFALGWCGLGSKSTVSSAINWLRDHDILLVIPRKKGERCNLYSLPEAKASIVNVKCDFRLAAD